MLKWDIRFLALASHVATWSKDPSKQVGAVITEKSYIRGIGFNGFPRAIADWPERLTDKELKNKLVVHAEINALLAARDFGDTIYVWPNMPCCQCLAAIIQAGITRVVYGRKKEDSSWDQETPLKMAEWAGIALIEGPSVENYNEAMASVATDGGLCIV